MKIFSYVLSLVVIISLSSACNPKTNVQITAHRGASGHAPENTISAMTVAIEMGAEYSELDVQETADGEIILLHDKTLTRTTGVEKNIWELNYSDLQNIDAGSWFDEKFKGEPIPTLAEVIQSVKGKMKLNIELKTNGHQKLLADRAVQVVADENYSENCIFTSFDFTIADRVKELDPKLKVGYIFGDLPENVNVFKANIDLLSVHYRLINEEFVKKAKEASKEIHVWTVNDEDEMRKFIELGITNIITNYPDKLKKIISDS